MRELTISEMGQREGIRQLTEEEVDLVAGGADALETTLQVLAGTLVGGPLLGGFFLLLKLDVAGQKPPKRLA